MEKQITPAAFFGHGTPMNALDRNRFTQSWAFFGLTVREPRAVLVVSAHWFINATAITAMERPRTIHDFCGFPPELFAVQYPAPGAPEIAAEIAQALRPDWIGLDEESWGFDHGAWSVLLHAYPKAHIPVLQLSINAQESFEYHLNLGMRLAALRERGVVVIGSGNVVHNLRLVDRNNANAVFDWARRFDHAAQNLMTSSPQEITRLTQHRDFSLAVPTPDHFIPLLYIAGLAAEAGKPADVLISGFAMGSLSMTSYALGAAPYLDNTTSKGAPTLDGPSADQTNL